LDRAAIRVATLNLRNTSDRWKKRAPLLLDQLAELRPDVIALQEVRVPADQARWIVDRVNARLDDGGGPYAFFQTNKAGLQGKFEGIAIMSRLPFEEQEWLDLHGGGRVAQRARLRLPGGGPLDVYNTHLHHERDAGELRLAQAQRILDWMAEHPEAPRVLAGDFNALRGEPPIALISNGLRSAYAAVHGREPERTVPTPLSAEWGTADPHVIDYIFVGDGIEVGNAWLTFDRIDPADPRLCASDHYGLAADISIVAASA